MGEDMGNMELLLTGGETSNGRGHYRSHFGSTSDTLEIELGYDSAMLLLGIYLRDCKSTCDRHTCTYMLPAVHNREEMEPVYMFINKFL